MSIAADLPASTLSLAILFALRYSDTASCCRPEPSIIYADLA